MKLNATILAIITSISTFSVTAADYSTRSDAHAFLQTAAAKITKPQLTDTKDYNNETGEVFRKSPTIRLRTTSTECVKLLNYTIDNLSSSGQITQTLHNMPANIRGNYDGILKAEFNDKSTLLLICYAPGATKMKSYIEARVID